MGKQFEIGKQYRIADLSKGAEGLQNVIAAGLLSFPEDNTFTCHAIDEDGDIIKHPTLTNDDSSNQLNIQPMTLNEIIK